MQKFDLESSPLFENFKGLKSGDAVYSRKYGLGYVSGFYGEEIIVQFSSLRKRFSVDDKEIRKVPGERLEKKGNKVRVVYKDEEMSYVKYKQKAGLSKRQIREEKSKYVTINEALDILGVTKSMLLKSMSENKIQTKTFDRSVMLHKNDLLKLHKKIREK